MLNYVSHRSLIYGLVADQDSRWGDAEKKLLRRTKFSKLLEQKVSYWTITASNVRLPSETLLYGWV